MVYDAPSKINIGSIVFLTLPEQEDGGIGIVLKHNLQRDSYYIYRILQGDYLWVETWEMQVYWCPSQK